MTRSLRTFVVVNPVSAGGSTRRRWDLIAKTLERAIGSFEHTFTNAVRHATTLAREALAAGFELIIAVGGDGTANEVACGFFEGTRPIGRDAVLGVIPHGTGCDLPRTMDRAKTVEEACARMAGLSARTIDVGHVSFIGHDDRPAERVFLNVLSFGCGGAVVHALRRGSKRAGGRIAFMLTTARVLFRYRDQPVTVSIDGGPAESLVITNYAVCNGRYFGGGMQVAPRAEVDDGLLDTTVWAGFGLRDFILKRRSVYDGSHVDAPGTTISRMRRLEATSTERVLLDVDGESAGRLPICVEVLPHALRVKI
ncbi:MAG TPA: diacylglycerol kinase family protein [Candidatus Binatia bacterium]|nr:diacylglycerol kinase family protein [Candidatus Binatia bacterium]